MDEAMRKDERMLRWYLAGLDVRRSRGRYELLKSLVRLPLRDHEALGLSAWGLHSPPLA
jgi:hypothetical protein